MPLSDIVNVTISLLTGGLSVPGFGIPMILSHNAAWLTDRIRFYTDPDGVAGDFAVSTPEYQAAAKIFSQDVRPEKIAIGRAALKPTQQYKLSIVVVGNSTKYSTIVGTAQADFISDPSATNDEIVAGLVAAITALSPVGFTATVGGTTGSQFVLVTGNAAGNWISMENIQPDLIIMSQVHADPGVATDLAAIKQIDNTWYGLVTLYNSAALITAAAGWVEANEKLYIPSVTETLAETSAFSGATDIIKTAYTAGYTRTAPMYQRSAGAFADAGWFGACLPLDPGSETWKFKTLNGVPVVTFTATQQQNVLDKRGNIYYSINGSFITAEGVTSSGQFIDTIRFRDWLKLRLQTELFLELKNAKKTPYTDRGIARLESRLRAVLDEGIEVGGIEEGGYTVTVPKAKNVSLSDKAARLLRSMKFTAALAGAIHAIILQGEITL